MNGAATADANKMKLHASIADVQLDNQLLTAVSPVVLSRRMHGAERYKQTSAMRHQAKSASVLSVALEGERHIQAGADAISMPKLCFRCSYRPGGCQYIHDLHDFVTVRA
jgi:hypothetical protein